MAKKLKSAKKKKSAKKIIKKKSSKVTPKTPGINITIHNAPVGGQTATRAPRTSQPRQPRTSQPRQQQQREQTIHNNTQLAQQYSFLQHLIEQTKKPTVLEPVKETPQPPQQSTALITRITQPQNNDDGREFAIKKLREEKEEVKKEKEEQQKTRQLHLAKAAQEREAIFKQQQQQQQQQQQEKQRKEEEKLLFDKMLLIEKRREEQQKTRQLHLAKAAQEREAIFKQQQQQQQQEKQRKEETPPTPIQPPPPSILKQKAPQTLNEKTGLQPEDEFNKSLKTHIEKAEEQKKEKEKEKEKEKAKAEEQKKAEESDDDDEEILADVFIPTQKDKDAALKYLNELHRENWLKENPGEEYEFKNTSLRKYSRDADHRQYIKSVGLKNNITVPGIIETLKNKNLI